ncbi:MAG TPA: EAL domain-containing protein [Usitatibacter sp.]|jgi:diguanylate cyclase (GGDEF)-like protein/PAS domain S-box-containing protein|nr:EAL domain-containing protein [Usitatibacter sp.]
MPTHPRPRSVALIALASGLAATLIAWIATGHQADREAQAEFASKATIATNVLERRIQRYIDVVSSLGALAYHDPNLNRAEFRRFVDALDFPHRLQGLQAVELVRRVPEAARAAFVAHVRADRSLSAQGNPGFDIRPAGTRDEYWVVDFIEPESGNVSVFGLDIRTRLAALVAAERARDTGDAAATGRYRLAQELGASYGLVFYVPVYEVLTPRTLEERRAALRAFVNVVVRVDDMLADMLAQPVMQGLGMRIHDLGAVDAPPPPGVETTVFYETPGRWQPNHSFVSTTWRREYRRAVVVAGRRWEVDYISEPAVNPWLSRLPLLVLGAGLAMTFLLYGMLRTASRARTEAVAIADRATLQLRTQLSFTQQLVEAIPNPVFFKDAGGRYIGCNRAFEEYIGLPREQIVGKTTHELTIEEPSERSQFADQEVLLRHGPQSYETSVVYAKDGTRHELILNKAAFYTPSGEVAGVVGVCVDITERKKLEADMRESNERLRAVIHAAPLAIIARDLDDVIRMWNPAAERMFGWREDEVLETRTPTVPEALRDEARALRRRAQQGETIRIEETRRQHRDGRLMDASVSIAPIYGADNVVIGTMATLVDISRRKQAEQALRESEAHLRLAMEAAQMGMWYWESHTDRFVYSDGFAILFGHGPNDPAVDYRALQERLHPDDRELFDATMRHAVKEGSDFQVDYRVLWPDGSVHWVSNRGQVHRGADGRAVRVIGVGMDITDRKRAEQRIAHMAHHDALTGLPNRALLRDRIQQAIAQAHRGGSQLAVLFIDLDRFKNINDSLGHQLGDRLLQSVASRILVCVREGDTVARVGGDEFVIVIPGIGSQADAAAVAAKILEVLGSPFHLHGQDLHANASIGISVYPADGTDAETLMRNADTAMYHAKDSGRANFQFFTQHMNIAAQQRLAIETALRHALEADEFEVHYQPLFDLRDLAITGFEALLRWNTADGEQPSTPHFIAAAEDSGLIVPIGEWVLREAMTHARAWQSAGRPLMLSVNVSATQLARPNFVERLRRLLEETAFDPALLELEVTEGVIIEGAGDAREALDHIAALGVGVAIDDFGTGYSGLAYLKRLPIDTVKIDQSFVRDLTVDPDDAAIVTAIVAMSQSLGIDVVAEGVETEEQLAELKRLGCHRAQGFLLAPPMDAAAIARLLEEATMAAD